MIEDPSRRRAAKPVEQRKEGVEFELGGEWFETLPEAPAAALNDLMAGITMSEEGDRVYSAPNLIAFVQAVLVAEDRLTIAEAEEQGIDVDDDDREAGIVYVPRDDVTRFRKVVTSKRIIVPIDELGDVALWVAEKLANRPFTPSRRQPPGRR
jgi:hypothetical protein